MGIDLAILGNHHLEFESKTYYGLGKEIKTILDNADFQNQAFIKEIFPDLTSSHFRRGNEWELYQEEKDFLLEHSHVLEFTGTFGFEFSFHRNKIIFWDTTFRYYSWFNPALKPLRNSWRKYFKALVNLFGGDRVIYLQDHEVCEIDDGSGSLTFSGFEKELQNRHGHSREMERDEDSFAIYNYFIDRFEDLNKK